MKNLFITNKYIDVRSENLVFKLQKGTSKISSPRISGIWIRSHYIFYDNFNTILFQICVSSFNLSLIIKYWNLIIIWWNFQNDQVIDIFLALGCKWSVCNRVDWLGHWLLSVPWFQNIVVVRCLFLHVLYLKALFI